MQNPIGVTGLTCGSMVYLPIWKCAHSFFKNSLRMGFKWSPIAFDDIQWDKQTVFAHILDPIERRHKGLAEYLFLHNMSGYLDKKNFRDFIRHIPVLDEHSMSYHSLFGEYCWMIDWIPLSFNEKKVIQLTEKLMSNHGQVLFNGWLLDYKHPSDINKINVYLLLKELWNENTIENTHSQRYLQRDINLFNEVLDKFNEFGDTWQEISWLRNRYGYK